MTVQNQLATLRRSRGLAAADLAKQAGISRQTIYAIEAGTYVPNTEVTLRLARALEVSVEQLFSLTDPAPEAPPLAADVLSATPLAKGQPVRVCRIGDRVVSVPVTPAPYFLPEADAVITKTGRRPELTVFANDDLQQKRLVLAGCDPAIGFTSRLVEKWSGVEIVSAPASSRLALEWLKEGKVHIAGSHLEDPQTGEFNLPFLKGTDFAVVTFARWEEGLVTAAGNPKEIRQIEQLARRNVRFVNREPGSGSRALLDRLLTNAGVPTEKVRGYERIAYGHLAAAYAVLNGDADCCLATRSAAQAFGLAFVPLRSERYDFILHRRTLELPAAQTFLDILQRATLRRKLEVLAGYDTSQTGAVLA